MRYTYDTYKFETIQLHAGQEFPDPATDARAVPIYQTTSYVFRDSAHAAARFGLSDAGNIYGRLTNSTQEVFETRIAALEGGAAALATASGAAAIAYTIEALAQKGDHIVAQKTIYGGSYNLLAHTLPQYGIETTFVNAHDLKEVEDAIQEHTKAIYLETPTNPTMEITDLRALAELAHKKGLLVIVDNTFLTPYFQRPLELGCDIVLHSGTKYLAGHNDILAGFVISREKSIAEKLRSIYKTTGACLSVFDAWLMLRSLRTLPLRMRQHEKNAETLAAFLKTQPYVQKVLYPGLPEHPGYEIQKKQATGFGGMISFYVDTPERAKKILEGISLIQFAESLGGAESLMTYPRAQTHADLTPEEAKEKGITDTLLRFSVGLEDVEDLKEDLLSVFKNL